MALDFACAGSELNGGVWPAMRPRGVFMIRISKSTKVRSNLYDLLG